MHELIDANASQPALEDIKKRNMAPDEILVDFLYGGDENCQKAKEDYALIL